MFAFDYYYYIFLLMKPRMPYNCGKVSYFRDTSTSTPTGDSNPHSETPELEFSALTPQPRHALPCLTGISPKNGDQPDVSTRAESFFLLSPRQGSNFTLDRRPEASDFSFGPVNFMPNKSGGLVFFFMHSNIVTITNNYMKYIIFH